MKYRLGLDLGVGSIGSAVIELDKENNAEDIIDAGVRIFKVSEGAEERRLKRTARKNLIRTRKRLELLAKILHENNLWVSDNPEGTNKLRAKSPYEIRCKALYEKLEDSNYIGRAILHLAKHRGAGFVSANEDNADEIFEEGENPKKKLSSYDMLVKHVKETNSQTIGEFFYKRLMDSYIKDKYGNHPNLDKRVIRQKSYALTNKIVDYAIPRYLVKDEFNKIWNIQMQYFPQMQKEELKQKVYDILFYERPPVPYATGKCIYYRNEDRLLKAHPLFEMRRIYEEVNNIRIETTLAKRKLSLEERNQLVDEYLMKGKNTGKQIIKKALKLDAKSKISLVDDKIIKAYLYSRPEFEEIDYIKNLTFKQLCEFADFLANPVNQNDKNGRLYNEDELISYLKPILKINDEKQIGDLLTKLPKGRGMIGKTASIKIIDGLKAEVISQREVTDKLSKEDKHFIAEEEIAREMQGKCQKLPYYGEILQTDTQPIPPLTIKNNPNLSPEEIKWGKIANPAVHMMLNQIRLVVNDIVRIYGKPYNINIEVGRDVGMSTKRKNQLEVEQRNNEKLNEEAKKYLAEHKLFINTKNILKYKLAKEQKWCDAYSPTSKISSNFGGFEIEHIIPQAKGGTDTYNNLCLVNRDDNLAKGNKFAYEYFVSVGKNGKQVKSEEEIQHILDNARKNTPNKAWRYESNAREEFEDNGDQEATDRYLTDTRYVSKMALRYLRAIIDCSENEKIENRILAVRGGQTAQLRKHWNLLGLEYDLMGLQIPRYIDCKPYWLNPDTGEVVEEIKNSDLGKNWKFINQEKNPEWMKKPRIDHRHHAMDAITVACTNRSLIQRIANENDINKTKYPMPLTSVESGGEFRRKVISVLQNINVSHKPEHSKAGQFHEETGKTILCQNSDDNNAIITVYVRKVLQVVKSFKDLNKLLIPDTIKDAWNESIADDKAKQKELKKNFETYLNTAEQILIAENEKAVSEGKKEKKITEAMIITKAFSKIKEEGLWKGDNFKCYESSSSLICIKKHNLAYKSGNNHCIDFFEKDGKVGWEVIKRFDANQPDFEPQWKKDGAKIIWSIQQGDILELDTPTEWMSYCKNNRCLARVKKFSSGKLTIDFITDARGTTKSKDEPEYKLVDSINEKGLNYFTDHNARKIELTPFGKIHKKHKALWNGQKRKV